MNAAFNDKLMENTKENFTLGASNSDGDSGNTSTSSPSSIQKANIKLSRSLTEKRKMYVQKVSARKGNNNVTTTKYGTLHQTFKSPVFKTFSLESSSDSEEDERTKKPAVIDCDIKAGITNDRINNYKKLMETTNTQVVHKIKMTMKNESQSFDKAQSAIDNISQIAKNEQSLFQMCLLIGFNSSTGSAYIKSKFPINQDVPMNIEQLVFPSSELVQQGRSNQEYSLIVTNETGRRMYGYCRRVLPETSEICLPLAYCLLSDTKAPGFYFKILKEIESRHGQTDIQADLLLKNLQSCAVPEPGKFLHLKLPMSPRPKAIGMSNHKINAKRLSLEINPKWLAGSVATTNSVNNKPLTSKKSTQPSLVQEFEDKKNLKIRENAPFDFDLINRSLMINSNRDGSRIDEILIRRPNDLRLECTELSDLYRGLGADLLINIFGSLLLERKVILYSKNVALLSSSVLGLQTILYPFQWQYTLVTLLPQGMTEISQAPFPVLAGVLEEISGDMEDGILVNLDTKSIQKKCGDENTILPAALRNSLLVSLEMVDILDQGKMLSSVLIAEAFLRFFVELFAGSKNQKIFKVNYLLFIPLLLLIIIFFLMCRKMNLYNHIHPNRFVYF